MDFLKGRKIAIATKHDKEKAMGTFLSKLGLEYFTPEGFDTDRFGTFTRDVARAGNQLEAARKKTEEVLRETGVDLAIASEGSFGADPEIPFVSSNLELVLLVDTKHGIEVAGRSRLNETNFSQATVRSLDEAVAFARTVGFPEHGVIIRKSPTSKDIHKEVTTWEAFEGTVTTLLKRPFGRKVFLETDMRAHRNPTRMENIRHAMRDLMQNIARTCPSCALYGFSPETVVRGLPCRLCKQPTDLPRAIIYRCQACQHSNQEDLDTGFADPGQCEHCNP